ncbi:MAG: hypothetical protein ACOC43_12760 [Desulfohalobiaceae bacterium]
MLRLQDVSVELDRKEVQQALNIAFDEDQKQALQFIQEVLAKKLKKKLTPQ